MAPISILRRRLPVFVLEFLTIIVGVLAAFALNNWREERQEQRLEQFYLRELVENLKSDEARLREVLTEQRRLREILLLLLDEIPAATAAGKPRIDSLYNSLRTNPTFFPAAGSYKAMVAEGALKFIRDKSLLTSLVELYEYYYVRINYLGKVLDEAVAKQAWERRQQFSLRDGTFYTIADMRSRAMTSILDHHQAFIGLYLGHAEATLGRIEGLRAAIERAVGD